MEQITLKFYYCGTRNRCDVCGQLTEKFHLGASGDLENRETIFVCEDCIKDPTSLDRRLTEHIEGFRKYAEKHANFIESLRGRLGNLPSQADWEKEAAEIREWEEAVDRKRANEAPIPKTAQNPS